MINWLILTILRFEKCISIISYLQDLNSRLVKAEARIAELEECDCAKPCVLSNSSVKRHEETWKEGCDTCKCVQGKVTCTQDTCEAVNCSKPDPPQPGSCCPTCRSKFYCNLRNMPANNYRYSIQLQSFWNYF